MATLNARDAKVCIGTATIAEMSNWSIEISADAIINPVFGDEWTRSQGLATTAWTASIDGLLDITDTTGQDIMRDATINGTEIANIRFYVDADYYYTSSGTGVASAGCYVTSHTPNAAQGDAVKVSYSITGDGPIRLTNDI